MKISTIKEKFRLQQSSNLTETFMEAISLLLCGILFAENFFKLIAFYVSSMGNVFNL